MFRVLKKMPNGNVRVDDTWVKATLAEAITLAQTLVVDSPGADFLVVREVKLVEATINSVVTDI